MIRYLPMPLYRSESSDDTKAWELSKSRAFSMHGILRCVLFIAIVLAVVLSARS